MTGLNHVGRGVTVTYNSGADRNDVFVEGPTVGLDLGTLTATVTTVPMTDPRQIARATLTAGVTSPITISAITANRTMTFVIYQAVQTANPGAVTINGTAVPVDVTSGATTFIDVFGDDLGNLDARTTAVSATTPTNSARVEWLTTSGTPITTGTFRDWFTVPVASEILGVQASTDGTDLVVDVNMDIAQTPTTTIFTTQTNRPNPGSANLYTAPVVIPDVVSVPAGARISLDVDVVGSTGGDLVSAGTYFSVSSSATTGTVQTPPTMPVGSLLVWAMSHTLGGGSTIATPTGWNLVGTREYTPSGAGATAYAVWMFWRIADGTEAASYGFTITPNGSVVTKRSQIFAYTSPGTGALSGPLDDVDTAQATTGTTHTVPANTATTTKGLRLALFRNAAGSLTPPAGMTAPGSIVMWGRKLAASGTTGTDAFTVSQSTGSAMMGVTFAVVDNPAPSSTKLKVGVRMKDS
jgi:hypothetical protein